MKRYSISFVLALLVSAASAHAADLNHYIFVGGGFGRDGATSQPTPVSDSIHSANTLFSQLKATVNFSGKKEIGIRYSVQGQESVFGLTCDESGCSFSFVLPADTTAIGTPEMPIDIRINQSLVVRGKVARDLFQALPDQGKVFRNGDELRTLANLSCHLTKDGAKQVPLCSFSHVNSTVMSMAQLVKSGLPEEVAQDLIRMSESE